MRTSVLIVGLVVGALALALYWQDRQDRTVEAAQTPTEPTLDAPTSATIEQLDEQGNVVARYEVERYEKGPAGIVAFVTTDGRRLFLDTRWRVCP